MQSQWLKKENHSSLIVFFTGWGMKPGSTGNLEIINHDLLVFYDYRDLQSDELNNLSHYSDITVVAWSMGIIAASNVMQEATFKPALSIAINGTGLPVSDKYGIPIEIYKGTTQALSENSLKKFLLRMCGSKVCYDRFMGNHIPGGISDLKEELIAIEQQQASPFKQKWDYTILCKNDAIFPYSNMCEYWNDRVQKLISIEAQHFPFFLWKSWNDIISFCKEKN